MLGSTFQLEPGNWVAFNIDLDHKNVLFYVYICFVGEQPLDNSTAFFADGFVATNSHFYITASVDLFMDANLQTAFTNIN